MDGMKSEWRIIAVVDELKSECTEYCRAEIEVEEA